MTYPIPDEIFKTHTAVTGKTGSGKSVTLAGMVERLFVLKRRVCIVDPKGDFWGLRYAADGKNPGLPIYLFGNFKNPEVSDVPLNPRLGKEMAKLVAESDASYVLGFRGWIVSDTVGFFIDFASTLYNVIDAPLNLLIDEMQNYAPKGKILSPQAAMCIHWSNKIMTEGRGMGLSVGIATQRPQRVHNDTLDCAETLVAMRSVHPRARIAISEWMDGHGDAEKSKEILNSLAGMKRGEAYVWSPENELMKRVSFPMIKTYDSYKPPTEQDRQLKPKAKAEVNLEKVKQRFATTIEQAKANDPSELKKKIAELKKELGKKKPSSTVSAVVDKKQIERVVAIETAKWKKAVDDLKKQHERIIRPYRSLTASLVQSLKRLGEIPTLVVPEFKPFTDKDLQPPGMVERAPSLVFAPKARFEERVDGELTNPEQRILDAIAWLNSIGVDEPEQPAVAFLAEYRFGGGAYNNPRGALRTKGLVEYVGSNKIKLTAEGVAKANQPSEVLTNEELHAKVMSRLPGPERKLLHPLLKAYPDPLSNEELANASGYSNGSGGYNNPRGRLRSLGLIEYQSGDKVRAKDLLFPENL